jgi:hypothetical protein
VLGGSSTPFFSSIIFKIIKLDYVVDISRNEIRHLKITKVLAFEGQAPPLLKISGYAPVSVKFVFTLFDCKGFPR